MKAKTPTIAISGMIGVGKTTLTGILEDEMGLEPMYEPVEENPLLAKFYKDPVRYGFNLQMFFLTQRFEAMQHALWHGGKILDRHLGEDIVFARQNFEAGNISDIDFQTYVRLLDNMKNSLRGLPSAAPDLTIYLESDLEHVMANIKKRGRAFEQAEQGSEQMNYYETLLAQYNPWYESYNWTPKLKFDMTQLDLNNPDDKDYMVNKILTTLGFEPNKPEED